MHARFKGRCCVFLAFDSASTHTDLITSEKKYRKLLNNVVFIRNESLFFVSAVATSAFQLEHTLWLLRSECPEGYQIRTIKYGKILVMLVYGEYYGQVYKVCNKTWYMFSRAHIVVVNKKFMFRIRSTIVLLCESSSKNGVRILVRKCSMHRFYGFRTGETLKHL